MFGKTMRGAMMGNECKGCKTYKGEKSHCSIEINPHMSETNKCPCLTCLIKSMCDYACGDLIKYATMAADKKHNREAWRKRRDEERL